jgi:hypothetical protein
LVRRVGGREEYSGGEWVVGIGGVRKRGRKIFADVVSRV